MNAILMILPIHTTALKVNMRCVITLLALLLAHVCKASEYQMNQNVKVRRKKILA